MSRQSGTGEELASTHASKGDPAVPSHDWMEVESSVRANDITAR